VCLTDLSSGSVRVVLASGEAGDDAVIKVKSGNDVGGEVTAVGMPLSLHNISVVFPLFSCCNVSSESAAVS